MINTKSDGIYISASNKSYKSLNLNKYRYEIVGSAHNLKEIKFKQNKVVVKFCFLNYF